MRRCGGCGQELDDPDVSCTRKGDQGFCAAKNIDINYINTPDEEKKSRPLRVFAKEDEIS